MCIVPILCGVYLEPIYKQTNPVRKPMTPLHSPSSSLSFGTLTVRFQQEMTEINQSLLNCNTPSLSSLKAFLFQSTPKFIFLELIGPYKRGLWPVLDNQVEENLSGTCLSIPGTQGGFPPTLGVISDFFLLGLNN